MPGTVSIASVTRVQPKHDYSVEKSVALLALDRVTALLVLTARFGLSK